ncbi:metal-dependent hydrolase [Marinobacter sp. MDS2]|uniref:metal-dependent hydrolase n=2 Tax=unclassified Marinobacter TaxID=83889 RepID=UPI00273C9762|nr:metal-dependent hydrolase [Marinobacter sp. MDS2]MDP4548668.1 metal-dependent hydrolase [Marinobacter sp. MDS2]
MHVKNQRHLEANMSQPNKNTPMLMPTRRDIQFALDPQIISEWHYSGGPVFTTFLNIFSTILPVGERFFIDSVRAYRDKIEDPELKKAVTAFIGQEAMHGREHEEYNSAFLAKTPAARTFERVVTKLLKSATKHAPKSFGLSSTIALEHFTALLADGVLSEPLATEGADPQYAALWRWHALEETEHKAVAYDVWDVVMGKGAGAYLGRSAGFVTATVIFWGLTIPAFIAALRNEGQITNWDGWKNFFRYTMGDIGLLRRQIGNYLDYFRPDFHPWDHDNREYLEQIDQFLTDQKGLAA